MSEDGDAMSNEDDARSAGDAEVEAEAMKYLRDTDGPHQPEPSPAYTPPQVSLPRYQPPSAPPLSLGHSAAFGPPVEPSAWGGFTDPGPPAERVFAPAEPRERQARERPAAPVTLEDLYARVPEFGSSPEYDLYVMRTSPKTWRGKPTSGYVGTVTEPISIDQFFERFGGTQYHVILRGPAAGITSPDGTFGKVILAEIKSLTIAGDPVLPDEMMGQPPRGFANNGRGGFFQPAPMEPRERPEDPKVAIERLRMEERRDEKRFEAERRGDPQAPMIGELAKDSLKLLHDRSSAQEQALREANTQLMRQIAEEGKDHRAELDRKSAELEQLRRELLDAQKRAFEASRATETETIRDLRARQQEEIARIDRECSQRLEAMSRACTERMEEQSRRYTDDRTRFESDASKERERLREEADRRERVAKDAGEARLADTKSNYEREIAATKDAHLREVKALTDAHQLELRSVERAAKSDVMISAKTTEMTQTVVDMRMTLLNEELKKANEELAIYRAEKNKPLHEQIEGVKANALALNLIPQNDAEVTPEAGGKWFERAADALIGVVQQGVQNAPQIIAQVAELRERNAAARQAQVTQAQPQPQPQDQGWQSPPQALQGATRVPQMAAPRQVPQQGQPRRGAPQGQPQQGQPRRGAPQGQPQQARPVARAQRAGRPDLIQQMGATPLPVWDSPVPGPGAPPAGIPAVGAGVMSDFAPAPAAVRQPAGPPAATAEPLVARDDDPGNLLPMDAVTPAQEQATAAAPAPEAQEAQRAQFEQFFQGLETAAKLGLPASGFVDQLLASVPEERVRQIMERVSVDQILALTSESSYLRKMAGKDYVRDVWDETKRRLGM